MKVSETNSTIIVQPPQTRATLVWQGVIWFLVVLATLLLVAKVIFSLNIVWQIFNFPFQTDESEGMIVAEVHLMDGGANIYAQPTTTSFVSAPYPPLYYLLNWPLLHFGGLSFKPGRAISLVATVGIAFLLYKLVALINQQAFTHKRAGAACLGGVAAALFWATLGLVAFWGDAVKPDMTALFFSLLGVWAAAKWANRGIEPKTSPVRSSGQVFGRGLQLFRNEGWLYLAAVAFALAVLTKQTAFAGPSAVLVFVLLRRPFAALRFAAVWLVLGFGPMLVMNVLSDGGYWWHNVIVHQLPWTFENYSKFMGGFLQSYQLYVLLALAFVVSWLFNLLGNWAGCRQNNGWLPVLYLGSSTLQGLSAGTYGGNHNHLLELAAAMCICAGLGLAQAWQLWQKANAKIWQKAAWPVVLGLLIVQSVGLFVGEGQVKTTDFPVLGSVGPGVQILETLQNQFYNPDWLRLQYRVPPAANTQNLENVRGLLDHVSGPVYSDNVSLVLLARKPLVTTDPFTQTHATFYGRWNETELVRMIAQQKFAAIAGSNFDKQCSLPPIYFSPAITAAVKQHYAIKYTDAECIFLPK